MRAFNWDRALGAGCGGGFLFGAAFGVPGCVAGFVGAFLLAGWSR